MEISTGRSQRKQAENENIPLRANDRGKRILNIDDRM